MHTSLSFFPDGIVRRTSERVLSVFLFPSTVACEFQLRGFQFTVDTPLQLGEVRRGYERTVGRNLFWKR